MQTSSLIKDLDGQKIARHEGITKGFGFLSVTRLGFISLNANQVMFTDTDCIPNPQNPKSVIPWDAAISNIQSMAESKNLTFRVYKTHSGVRAIETSKIHDPTSEETGNILRGLQCDNAFVVLTRNLSNFRSRLTPKPWRVPDFTCDFNKELDTEKFLSESPYAVAYYLGTIGKDFDMIEEIQVIVNLHDHFCKSDTRLPLA